MRVPKLGLVTSLVLLAVGCVGASSDDDHESAPPVCIAGKVCPR